MILRYTMLAVGDVGGGERQLGNLGAGAPVDYLSLRRGLPQAHQVHLDTQILHTHKHREAHLSFELALARKKKEIFELVCNINLNLVATLKRGKVVSLLELKEREQSKVCTIK